MLGGRDPSASPGLFLAVLGGLMASVSGINITLVPEIPKLHEKVLFNVSVQDNVFYYDWYRGNNTQSANQIIRYDPSDKPNASLEVRGLSYFKQARIYPNGSLEITDLQKAFEGSYTVSIQTKTLFQQTLQLNVKIPDGLSRGIIAAIVCSTLGVAVIIVVAVYLLVKKTSSEGPL